MACGQPARQPSPGCYHKGYITSFMYPLSFPPHARKTHPHRTPQTDQDRPAGRAGCDRSRWRKSFAAFLGVFYGRDPQSQHASGLHPRYGVQLALLSAAVWCQGFVSLASTRAADLRVCFHNPAGLRPPTLASMNLELSGLLHGKRVSLMGAPCLAESNGAALVVVRKGGLPDEPDVLGRAVQTKGRIMPILEVYLEPIVSLIGNGRSSKTVGRALARVAAHELNHFVDQTEAHSDRGLMQTGFFGWQLEQEDPYPFRRVRPSARRSRAH